MSQIEQSPPFRDRIGSHLGGSWHTDIHTLGQRHVLRTIRERWKILGGFVGSDWRKDFPEGYYAMQEYLGPQMVPTYLVEGLNHDGKPDLLIVHDRLDGRALKDIPYEELRQNPRLLMQFDDLTIGIMLMHKDTGRMPDIHGTPQLTHQYDMKRTDAIVVDDNDKVWLRDIETIGPLWSPHWAIGRLHMRKHMDSLHRFRKELGLEDMRREPSQTTQLKWQFVGIVQELIEQSGTRSREIWDALPLFPSAEIWPYYQYLEPPVTVDVHPFRLTMYSKKEHMVTLTLTLTPSGLEVGEGSQDFSRIFHPVGKEEEAYLRLGMDLAEHLLQVSP